VTKLERNTIGSVATLQECFDKLGRYGSCTLSRRSIQMAPIRTGSHPACGRWYLRFSLFLPRRRRTLGRTRDFGRSRHALALSWSAMRRSWSRACVKGLRQQTILGGRRDVRPGQKQMGVLVPGRGFRGCNDGLFTLGQTRCSRRRALSDQSLGRGEPSGAAGNQYRRARRLSTGNRAAQSRGGSGGEMPPSTGAVP
jgi:hypothetical protein